MADKFGSDTIVIIRNDNLPLLQWLKTNFRITHWKEQNCQNNNN